MTLPFAARSRILQSMTSFSESGGGPPFGRASLPPRNCTIISPPARRLMPITRRYSSQYGGFFLTTGWA
eukprot:6136065-Pyramimonas_sp.AAC.1